MTDTSDTGEIAETAPKTVDEAREQVEQTRSDLTDTLENLTDKLDKKEAKAKVHDLRGQVHDSTAALSTAASRARDAMPTPLREGIDSTAQAVRPAVAGAVATAKSHRRPLVPAGVGGLLAFIARGWRRS